MSTYLRFQTDVLCPRARIRLGLFRALDILEDENRIEYCYREWLETTVQWFNQHLRAPRFPRNNQRFVFWFCTRHQLFITRMWDIVAFLNEHQIPVQQIRTSDPGMIVYRDDYQVAAIPNQRIKHALRV